MAARGSDEIRVRYHPMAACSGGFVILHRQDTGTMIQLRWRWRRPRGGLRRSGERLPDRHALVRGAGPAVAIERTSPSTQCVTVGSSYHSSRSPPSSPRRSSSPTPLAAAVLLDARAISCADPSSEVEKRMCIRIGLAGGGAGWEMKGGGAVIQALGQRSDEADREALRRKKMSERIVVGPASKLFFY